MIDRAARLRAYVSETAGRPVMWGADDCCAWPARWIEREAGVTLALPAYDSAETAAAVIAAGGGLVDLVGGVLAEVGINEAGSPELGDVGIIRTGRFGLVGVIFAAGGAVYWREAQGVTVLIPRVVEIAWRVPEAAR